MPIGRALDAFVLAYGVELDQHIAAIAAAGRFHQLAEGLRPGFSAWRTLTRGCAASFGASGTR